MTLPRYAGILLAVFVLVLALTSPKRSTTKRSSISLQEVLINEKEIAGQVEDNIDLAENSSSKAIQFSKDAAAKVANQPNVRGEDSEWFFLVRELKQIAAGKFWEKPWEETAANKTDPLPSMLEFQKLLADKGIKLLVAPVPAKAMIYPEKFSAKYSPGDVQSLSPLIEKFQAAGLNVFDLEPLLLARRKAAPDDRLFCAQDAHFTPLTCELISDFIVEQLGGNSEEEETAGDLSRSPVEVIEIKGDQVIGSEWEEEVAPEKLNVRYAGRKISGKIIPVQPDPSSPVLLIGDSHTLVFHEGAETGMHCKGAGLFDHMSARFGFPIDLVGVRGSGLVQARKQLYYRAAANEDYWADKKVVVWVFSTREFTQSFDKIVPIPIER